MERSTQNIVYENNIGFATIALLAPAVAINLMGIGAACDLSFKR